MCTWVEIVLIIQFTVQKSGTESGLLQYPLPSHLSQRLIYYIILSSPRLQPKLTTNKKNHYFEIVIDVV